MMDTQFTFWPENVFRLNIYLYVVGHLPVYFSLSIPLWSGTCLKVQSSLVQPIVRQKKHSVFCRLQWKQMIFPFSPSSWNNC